MEKSVKLRNVGLITFLLSGLCATSSGVVVSLLQEKYGFSFGTTGTLLSVMSIGNMLSAFLAGILPGRIGLRRTVLTLSLGFTLGYALMPLSPLTGLLLLAFFLVGLARGSTLNVCNLLVGQNSEVPARGLTLLHAFFAVGALLGPVFISLLVGICWQLPILLHAALGLLMWFLYLGAALPGKQTETQPAGKASGAESGTDVGADITIDNGTASDSSARQSDLSFLKEPTFWILAALLFFQNGTEQSINGWLVTYYRNEQILSGVLSNYTVTIVWTATLIGRLLTAFVFPVKENPFRTVSIMGFFCCIFYGFLVQMHTPVSAIVMLSLFAFSMSSINPIAVSGIGARMSPTSLGVLLPLGSIGAILWPWLIGLVSDSFGLRTGMAIVLLPCLGMFAFSFLMMRRSS